jgi:hypothetical protein
MEAHGGDLSISRHKSMVFYPGTLPFLKSMAHFSQNSFFHFPFLVNIIKSRKKFDF